MKSIKILDCTLRDGGFVNDWKFGFGSIKSIVSRLDQSGIEIVEIGFLDNRREIDQDKTILPDTASFAPLLNDLSISNAMIVGMIDFGTCPLSSVDSADKTKIDGIRVIFKKKDQDDALAYLAEIKKKGYKIFVNPVSITGYSDNEIVSLIEKINVLDPYAVSVVDTYGLMHGKDLDHYFSVFNSTLKPEISIGYHSHNNFQLAYSNSIELMKKELDRKLIIDCSLYGMGKGAGNANTELIAMYLNENYAKQYDINQLLEAIDVDILKELYKGKWGYSLPYYISALNDCHPEYVKYLLGKKTLAVKSVNEIIAMIPIKDKLSFNHSLVEKLYTDYQNIEYNDEIEYQRLSDDLEGRKVLLLGPGTSIIEEKKRISGFIEEHNPVVISINFLIDAYPIDYVFMGNSKRYSQFFHKIYGQCNGMKVICTSNITESTKQIDYLFNFNSLLNTPDSIRDNPLLMLLKILNKCQITDIVLAGFDGYTIQSTQNYYNEYIPLLYCQDNVLERNKEITNVLASLSTEINISSITKTLYLSDTI